MSGRLAVLDPGPQATVQDLGRPGFRRHGVPVSGAADRALLRLVNRLLGNEENAAAIEFRLAGPKLKALDAPLRVAVGGDALGRIVGAGDGEAPRELRPWHTCTLQPGDALHVGPLHRGMVGYVAVAGGLDLPPVMGSRSTYLRGAFGGHRGRALRAADDLHVGSATPTGGERRLRRTPLRDDGPIHVVLGPQDDHFTDAALQALCTAEFRVSDAVDRMGARLAGPPLEHRPEMGADLESDGLVPGAIQVPGDGQPIVLCVDCQTVGGYPKIATVASADLDRIGQLRPGEPLRFQAVTLAEADRLARDGEAWLDALARSAEGYAFDCGFDLRALYDGNLISGVFDAGDA